MQSALQKGKPNHFSIYKYVVKLTSLAMCCFFVGCSGQKQTQQVLPTENQFQIAENAVNINTASAAELEKLPHIGAKTAKSIIEFREKYGKFRKPEYLMLVRRVSDLQFREIRSLVKVE